MSVILTATGFKIGSKGKVVNNGEKAASLFGSMPKGEARKLRKQLRAEGLVKFAAIPACRAA